MSAVALSLDLFSRDLGFEFSLATGGAIDFPLIEGLESDGREAIVLQVCALLFNLLLQSHFIFIILLRLLSLVFLKHVALRKHVPVWAEIGLVGADPVKTVKILFDCIKEVSASDNRVRGFALLGSGVRVEINSHGSRVLKRQIVTVFALLSLLTDTGLEVGTERVFEID